MATRDKGDDGYQDRSGSKSKNPTTTKPPPKGKDIYPVEMPPLMDSTPPKSNSGSSAADLAAMLQAGMKTTINISGGGYGGGGGGASKKERAKNIAAEISDRLKQLGLTWTDAEIAKVAKQAVDDNWSETVITDKLLAGIDWNNVTGGDLTAGADMLKAMSASYMLPLTSAQAQEWSLRMARGEMTQQGVESMMREQSKARFGWLAPQIDQGVKPSDYFDPIRNVIADTLEMTPASINLLDPQWMGMVEVVDAKTGGTRAATMNEAMLAARQRPEWAATKQAQDMTFQMGNQIAGLFGRAA